MRERESERERERENEFYLRAIFHTHRFIWAKKKSAKTSHAKTGRGQVTHHYCRASTSNHLAHYNEAASHKSHVLKEGKITEDFSLKKKKLALCPLRAGPF